MGTRWKLPPFRHAYACAALVIIAAAVNANSLANGFVWDDLYQILGNPWVRNPAQLGDAFTHDVGGFGSAFGFQTNYYRPLMHVALASVYAVAGPTPWAFHLSSVALHVVVTVFVYLLASRTAPGLPAFVAAALFAVHPVHVEAVAWASAIPDLSYTLCSILVLLLLVTRWRWGAPVAFALALLFKEPALMLFPIAIVIAASDRRWVQMGALALVALAYVAARVYALGGLVAAGRPMSFVEVVLTGCALFGEYAVTLLASPSLSVVHDVPITSWRVGLGLVAAVAAALVAWRLPKARLGVALTVLPLLPALYVPGLSQDSLFAERYVYLPSVGVALILALAAQRWPKLLVPMAMAVIVCAAATVARNRTWRDERVLFMDAANKAPRSAYAHHAAGTALLRAGEWAEAAAELSRALELDSHRIDAREDLASALGSLGRVEEARDQVTEVMRELPDRPDPAWRYQKVCWALVTSQVYVQAIDACERALEHNPRLADVHNRLGVAYASTGRGDLALVHFEAATQLDPANQAYRRNRDRLQAGGVPR
jgi:Tfp pilus assembly protein PilF